MFICYNRQKIVMPIWDYIRNTHGKGAYFRVRFFAL